MSRSIRERDYARRRQAKWAARRAARQAYRRRVALAWLAVGAVVAGTLVTAQALSDRPAEPLAAPGTPTPSDTAPAYTAPPDPALAEGRTWSGTLATSAGPLEIELDGAAAPQAVANFLMLSRDGFYDGTTCHRLVVGSLLQCGDPEATGFGGPGYWFGPIENAPEAQVYPAGTIAMARRGGDGASQGSQFFIVLAETPLPNDEAGGYTVFGRVVTGLEALGAVADGGTVDGSADGAPATPVTIEGVDIP